MAECVIVGDDRSIPLFKKFSNDGLLYLNLFAEGVCNFSLRTINLNHPSVLSEPSFSYVKSAMDKP